MPLPRLFLPPFCWLMSHAASHASHDMRHDAPLDERRADWSYASYASAGAPAPPARRCRMWREFLIAPHAIIYTPPADDYAMGRILFSAADDY